MDTFVSLRNFSIGEVQIGDIWKIGLFSKLTITESVLSTSPVAEESVISELLLLVFFLL